MSNNSNPSLPPESCEFTNETTIPTKSGMTNDCCHDATAASNTNSSSSITDSRFSCNICFDEVVEPVVTRCGHLYCWPCLFQWLEPGMRREERESLGMSGVRSSHPSRRVCPVCKAECPISSVVPVYVRSASPSRSSFSKAKANAKARTNSNSHSNSNSNENEIDGPSQPENDGNSNSNLYSNSIESMGIGAADGGLRQRRANRTTSEDSSNNNSSSNGNSSSEDTELVDVALPVPVPNRPTVTRSHQQHYQEEPPSSPPMSRRSSPGSSPQATRANTDNPYRVGGVQLTPRSPNGHNGSLTYSMLSSLQRATAEYYRNNSNSNTNTNNNNNHADDSPDNNNNNRRLIPSLHDRRNPLSNHNADGSGRFEDSAQQGYHPLYNNESGNGNGISNGDLNSETTQYLTRLLIMLTSFVIFCFLAV